MEKDWYILKVQVNREDSIRDALHAAGQDRGAGTIISTRSWFRRRTWPEFNKSGKRRIVKRKLYPGYIMVHMAINDDTWFLVRETPGIGDFHGFGGQADPHAQAEM